MIQPVLSADAFRALARSSPWRWRTLHFRHRSDRGEVEAWIRRPGEMVVVDTDGREHRIVGEPRTATQVFFSSDGPDGRPSGVEVVQLQRAADLTPVYRPDGLVAERPDPWDVDLDDPMWINYHWVAMLDPYELSHHVDVAGLREERVHDRRVWRADLRALPGYDPRCGSNCCELLWSEASWYADFGGQDDPDPDAPPIPEGTIFPDHYDVALDVQTGIVVRLAPVGESSHADWGFEVDILEVDADLDGMFA